MTSNIESKSENGPTLDVQEKKEDPDHLDDEDQQQQQDNRPRLEVLPPIDLTLAVFSH